MADHRGGATHEAHDLELVARAAANDLAASEAIAARELVASCATCATVAADLRAITAATRELGSAASRAASAPAPRDFRLTEPDAERLRRRRFLGLGRFADRLGGRTRGFGSALAALGLAGLLVSAAMPSLFFGAGGAVTSEPVGGAAAPAAAAPGPADSLLKDAASMAAEVAPAASDAYALTASEVPARVTDAVRDGDSATVGGSVVLAIGSGVVLLAGLALLLASRSGRRAGP